MARKKKKGTGDPVQVPVMPSIEELFKKHGVPRWQQRGLMRARNWAAGRRVNEAEFLHELNAWLSGPVRR